MRYFHPGLLQQISLPYRTGYTKDCLTNKISNMRNTLISLIMIVLFSAHSFSQWSKQGLHDLLVHQMQERNDTIYACTSDGIYVRHFLKQDDPWEAVGLQGYDVTDVFFSDDGRILANVRTRLPWYTSVYIKEDNTFELLAEHETIYSGDHHFRMLTTSVTLDTIFDLSASKKTYDGGKSWHGMFETWNMFRFIKTDSEHPNKVWVGGEATALTPILYFSTDYGENFETLPLHGNFFGGDNCTHWIIRNDTTWYVPGEGVIGRSDDGGYTWETLLDVWDGGEMSLYFYDIAFSPADSKILYATGDSYEPVAQERLNIVYSTDEGKNWQLEWHQFEEDHNYPVRKLLVMHDDGRDIIFLGADGVYAFEHPVVNKPDMPDTSFTWDMYPNPASGEFHIRVQNAHEAQATITIHDLQGRKVRQKIIQLGSSDLYQLIMPAGSLEPGAYVVSINDRHNKQTQKLIIH